MMMKTSYWVLISVHKHWFASQRAASGSVSCTARGMMELEFGRCSGDRKIKQLIGIPIIALLVIVVTMVEQQSIIQPYNINKI